MKCDLDAPLRQLRLCLSRNLGERRRRRCAATRPGPGLGSGASGSTRGGPSGGTPPWIDMTADLTSRRASRAGSHGRRGPSPISGWSTREPLTALAAGEPAAGPQQSRGATRHPQVMAFHPPPVGRPLAVGSPQVGGNGARSGRRRPRRPGAQVKSTTPTASGRRGPSSDAGAVRSA